MRTWDAADDEEQQTPETTATVVENPTEDEPETTTPSPEPPRILPLTTTIEGNVDEGVVTAIEAAIEAAASPFAETCAWRPELAQPLVIGANHEFRRDDEPRAWEETLGRSIGVFPAGGLAADDRDLRVVAGHWVARAAVADLSGDSAPAWVPLGLAFYQEARSMGLERDAFIELSKESDHIPLVYWGATPGRNPPGNVARAESMVEYLVERGGPRAFARFLEAMRTRTLESALEEVYGVPVADVQSGWEMFLKTRYLGLLSP